MEAREAMELGDDWPPYVFSALDRLLLASPPSGQPYLEAFMRRWGGYDSATLLRVARAGDVPMVGEEGDEQDRLFALLGLGYLRLPEARDALLPYLASARTVERWAAALGLGRLRDERARSVLNSMLVEFYPLGPATAADEYYTTWPASVPSLLAEWGEPQAVAPLRHALQAALHAEQAVPEASREQWTVAGRQVEVERDSDRTAWQRYENEIVYSLGRLAGFGALTGVAIEATDERLTVWRVHLVLGYLQGQHALTGVLLWQDNPHLREDVTRLLERVFGLTEEERDHDLEVYADSLTGVTLMLRRQRKGAGTSGQIT
jgi:HEAT repeats